MEFTNEELTKKVLDFDEKFDALYAKVLTIENDVQHLDARVKTIETETIPSKADVGETTWKIEKMKQLIRELANLVKEDIKLKKDIKNGWTTETESEYYARTHATTSPEPDRISEDGRVEVRRWDY